MLKKASETPGLSPFQGSGRPLPPLTKALRQQQFDSEIALGEGSAKETLAYRGQLATFALPPQVGNLPW